MYSKSNMWKIRSLIVLIIILSTSLNFNAKTICNDTESEQYVIDQAGHKQIIPPMMCGSINDEVVNTLVTENSINNLTTNNNINEEVIVSKSEENLKIEKNNSDVLENKNIEENISTEVNMTMKREPNEKSKNRIKITFTGIILGVFIVFIFRRKYIYEKN